MLFTPKQVLGLPEPGIIGLLRAFASFCALVTFFVDLFVIDGRIWEARWTYVGGAMDVGEYCGIDCEC